VSISKVWGFLLNLYLIVPSHCYPVNEARKCKEPCNGTGLYCHLSRSSYNHYTCCCYQTFDYKLVLRNRLRICDRTCSSPKLTVQWIVLLFRTLEVLGSNLTYPGFPQSLHTNIGLLSQIIPLPLPSTSSPIH
jgi:hypothetical protein